MGKHWTEVKKEIEAEIDKCWYNMPLEIEACRAGIFFSKAGARNTYIGNLYYGIQDPMSLGMLLIEGTLYSVLGDDNFSLGQFTRNYTQTTKRGLLTTNKG